MQVIHQLGNEIETAWRGLNYDEAAFPTLAADALRAAGLPDKVSAWDVLEWSLRQTELPRQRDVYANFGDPPITVYSAPKLNIDVYFWFEGTTSIHQHAFCGAFQVLLGSSIHSWYDFEPHKAVSSFMETGRLQLKTCDLLSVGDVQEIRPGRQYIHSLFHLDQPSATVVVRTDKIPLYQPQYSYFKPSLAIDPFYEQETLTKKLQVINALISARRDDADGQISMLLAESDLYTSFIILNNVRRRLTSGEIDRIFGTQAGFERFERLVDVVRERHGEDATVFSDVFRRNAIVEELARRRSIVTDPEHRFLFALLMNVDGRDEILSLIARRFPDTDPVEKILDWTYDLAQLRIAGAGSRNALGIAGFDDVDLQLLEYMLRETPADAIAGEIGTNFPKEKAEQMLSTLPDRMAAIRNSVVFSSLI